MLGSACRHGVLQQRGSISARAPAAGISLSPALPKQQPALPQPPCLASAGSRRSSRRNSSSAGACKAAQKEHEPAAANGQPVVVPPQQQHNIVQEQQEQLLRGVGSQSVHEGERGEGARTARTFGDTLTVPIAQTSTYYFGSTQQVIDYNEGRSDSNEYGRYGNPTVTALQEKLKALEGAEDCVVAASGMSSVTSMLLSLVPAGGHIVTTSDCYWRTRQFMQQFLPKMNIGVSVIAPDDLGALERELDAKPVTLYFSESPTNPYLRCIDIRRVCDMCHAKGTIVCIDSTFSTPINSRALDFGADLVLHSATKYLAGHNDVLAGALLGKPELVETVRKFHFIIGGVIDPHAAYLLMRGLKTLELRVLRHNATGMEIAKRLSSHPKVVRVWYPGLESHPDHAIAVQQMSGFGGVVSFEIQGGLYDTARFIDALKIPYIAPSLGGVESLIEMPAVQSYWSFGPEGRAQIGIKENLVRFAIGIENVEDIWADVVQALAYV